MLKGIDVSYYQTIDFNKIKDVDFSIIRAGYGKKTITKDKKFESFYEGFKNKSIALGAYWYSYAITETEAIKEAEHCISVLGNKKFEYPIYIDIEEKEQKNIGKDKLTKIALAFCDKVSKAGYSAGVYANRDFFINYLDGNKIYSNGYSVWIARYNSKLDYAKNYDIWQYSSSGSVSGISGNVDVNYCYNNKFNVNNSNNVSISNENSSIKDVQTWLNNSYNVGLVQDGIYGSKTKKALIKALQTELNMQFKKGLIVDGIFGNKTYNACVIVKMGGSGAITKILQGSLICKGYNVTFDGSCGEKTVKTIKEYQKNNKLIVDGIAGKNTWESLFK